MARTLLDAYALIALLGRERAAPAVRGLISSGECAVQAVNVFEVLDFLERVRGVPAERTAAAVGPLLETTIEVVDFDLRIARRAATLRARHYHRVRCPISLADCALIASAHEGESVATADRYVLQIAEGEGLRPVELPSRHG